MKVAIVGAGLLGRLLGWRLSEQGAEVTLFDQQARDHRGTGLVAAAMIAPATEAVTTEPLVKAMGVRSLALWQPWLKELTAATDQPVYFKQAGTLVVAHAQDQADWLRFMQHAEAKVSGCFVHLNQGQLKTASPALAENFSHAGFFPDEAVLDNAQLYTALARYFEQNKIDWHEEIIFDEVPANGQLKGFDDAFDWVFDCRGAGAQGFQAGLRAVRGEVMRVVAPEVDIRQAVRLMHPRYPLYIAPKPNHQYVIGATQIESAHQTPVTVRSGLELLSALYSLHKGFAEAQITQLEVGLRPAFSDNLPRLVKQEKRIEINGLYRHGYLFAPAMVEQVLDWLAGQAPRFIPMTERGASA
ncbi:MAG: glycine oxidase ThiO [Arenicellales bacterium]